MSLIRLILGLSLAIISGPALAQTGIPLITATQATGGTEYSLTLQLLLLMTMLTLLPSPASSSSYLCSGRHWVQRKHHRTRFCWVSLYF
jgi:hypothetical protein